MSLVKRSVKRALTLSERAEGSPSDSVGVLKGYIAVFNSDSYDLGGFTERIKPGAFGESLKRNDVVALVNHEHTLVVGRLSAGTLRLGEDETGLTFEVDIPDTQAGRDLRTLARRGDLQGCSFGFEILGDEWHREGGKDFCTLTEIDLHEVSVGVTFPAYGATSMELRRKGRGNAERARARDRMRLKARNAG